MPLVSTLITELRQKIPAPSITLALAYVRAARQFCGESRWYRVTLDATLGTLISHYDISPDADALVEVVDIPFGEITDRNGKKWPLYNSDASKFNPNASTGMPRYYAYVPESEVAFDRVADYAYPVSFALACQPQNGVQEIPDQLINKWDRVLQAGALEHLYSMSGQPWHDKDLAEKKGREFRAGIHNAKVDVARAYQSGSVRGGRQGFIV